MSLQSSSTSVAIRSVRSLSTEPVRPPSLQLYRPPWLTDISCPPDVRKLCTVEVTVPTGARFTWKEDKDGNSCKACGSLVCRPWPCLYLSADSLLAFSDDVQVQLQLGQAEMKARAKIAGELVGSAKIVIPS